MPSSSEKQAKFMEAVGHNPKFAKKAGVPQKVGKEYAAADKAAKMKALKNFKSKRPAEPDGDEGAGY